MSFSLDASLQPVLQRYGVSTPDELPDAARAVYDKAYGWLQTSIGDEAKAATAIGLSAAATASSALPVLNAIMGGLRTTDSLAAFNSFCLAMGAVCPEAAPFIAAFDAGVNGMMQMIQAAGLNAKGAGDPCAKDVNGDDTRWFGNFDLKHELPPSDPSDPRWIHWFQDGGKKCPPGPGNTNPATCECGYQPPSQPIVAAMNDAMRGKQTPFDQACAVAWAHVLEAYANAKGPSPFQVGPGWLTAMAAAWNATHSPTLLPGGTVPPGGKALTSTYYAKRAPFGSRTSWQQYVDGAWQDIPPPKGGPFGMGSDVGFVSWLLSQNAGAPSDVNLYPLQLTVNAGPLRPELEALMNLQPPAKTVPLHLAPGSLGAVSGTPKTVSLPGNIGKALGSIGAAGKSAAGAVANASPSALRSFIVTGTIGAGITALAIWLAAKRTAPSIATPSAT